MKAYSGRKVGFIELGACIFSSAVCINMIRRREVAEEAEMEYLLDRTDEKYEGAGFG